MACQHPLIRPVLGAFRHIFACSCSSTMINNPHPSSSAMGIIHLGKDAEGHHESWDELDTVSNEEEEAEEEEVGLMSTLGGSSRGRSARRVVKNIQSTPQIDYLDERCELVIRRLKSVAELHAIFKHLQVRWQLFNDSLFKFRDLESMLANCTEDVIWSTENGEMIRGKTPELLYILQSLIKREVSLEVEIDRIVRVSPCGYPELALDKYGHCGTPTTLQVVQSKVAMEILGLVKSSTTLSNALANDRFSNLRYPYLILAHDRYTLRNMEGDIIERGKRAILWQRLETSWYICGCLCYPLSSANI